MLYTQYLLYIHQQSLRVLYPHLPIRKLRVREMKSVVWDLAILEGWGQDLDPVSLCTWGL